MKETNHACDVIFDGSKTFWREGLTLDMLIVVHSDVGTIEVVAYDPFNDIESNHLFLDPKLVDAKQDRTEVHTRLAEVRCLLDDTEDSSYDMDNIVKEMRRDYIISRMKAVKHRSSNRKVVSIEIFLVPGINDSIEEEIIGAVEAVIPRPQNCNPVNMKNWANRCSNNTTEEEEAIGHFELRRSDSSGLSGGNADKTTPRSPGAALRKLSSLGLKRLRSITRSTSIANKADTTASTPTTTATTATTTSAASSVVDDDAAADAVVIEHVEVEVISARSGGDSCVGGFAAHPAHTYISPQYNCYTQYNCNTTQAQTPMPGPLILPQQQSTDVTLSSSRRSEYGNKRSSSLKGIGRKSLLKAQCLTTTTASISSSASASATPLSSPPATPRRVKHGATADVNGDVLPYIVTPRTVAAGPP